MTAADSDLRAAEERILAAIKARHVHALRAHLTDDFIHTDLGGADRSRDAFLRLVHDAPYAIVRIAAEGLRVRVLGETAVVSGIQRARVSLPEGTFVTGA